MGPIMIDAKVSEIREHLASYLAKVQAGEEIRIISRGKVIARIVPEVDEQAQAKAFLDELRKTAWVGDVESPIDVDWDAEHGRM